jgi:hypothetical protein
VTGVEHLRLSSVEDAAWAALGYDAETEDFIGLVGRIGTGEIKRQALGDEDGGAVVALSRSGRGLRTLSELTPLAGLPWTRLLYTRSLPRESRVWRLDDGREHFVAALPAHARCHLVGRGLASVVCIGSDRGRTLVWRFDLATGPTADTRRDAHGRSRPRSGRSLGRFTGGRIPDPDRARPGAARRVEPLRHGPRHRRLRRPLVSGCRCRRIATPAQP